MPGTILELILVLGIKLKVIPVPGTTLELTLVLYKALLRS